MIPTDPQDDTAAELPDGGAALMQPDPNRSPETPAEPEESDEEWMRRFIEENIHLASPPVVRPPAPPAQPWDGPRSQWKVPDHLSMPHPKGGYMAMALMSRTMDDLDEVTGGKRAATYEEVDKYLGHALIAEGLVPFTYTADEAIRWWRAGGYRVLGGGPVPPSLSLPALPKMPSLLAQGWSVDSHIPDDRAGDIADAAFMVDPNAGNQARLRPAVLGEKAGAFDAAVPAEHTLPGLARDTPELPTPFSSSPKPVRNSLADPSERPDRNLLPEADIPLTIRHPQRTFKVGADWIVAARIKDEDIPRLSGRDIIATPEIRAAAAANIARFAVKAGGKEILAYGYLMPDGTIEVRIAAGKATNTSHTGLPSGPGKVIFGIHGHPAGLERMLDDPDQNDGFGDTKILFRRNIPMATVYDGKIAWHEMSKGQLTFTVPASAMDSGDLSKLQGNLNIAQGKFLKPK